MTLAPLEWSYRRAERVTAEWASSFYFASWFLPVAKRRAVFAIYDFCRHADNLVDQRGERSVRQAAEDLSELKSLVVRLHTGVPPVDRRWLALYDTFRRYPVPLPPLLELLEGVALDLGPVAVPDFPTLERYCRQVAGGVGLMIGPVLGVPGGETDEAGVRLGIAMQLTNVLRDVREDLDQDRVYLPADELRMWGISREDLESRRMSLRLRGFLGFQVCRAREYFESAEHVAGYFPDDGSRLTIRLLLRTYAGILDRIEQHRYDVFQRRAYVPFARKLVILGRTVLRHRAFRRPQAHAASA
jgi:15-cis-phytoene synthase